MKKLVQCGYRAMELSDRRVDDVRAGRVIDATEESQHLRFVCALLLDAGVLRRNDWEMSGVPLASRGAAIDALRANSTELVTRRVEDLGHKNAVELGVMRSLVPAVSAVLVEMACLVFSHDTILDSLIKPSCRHRRLTKLKVLRPGLSISKAALHHDPVAFLQAAIQRRTDATIDISRAKKHADYLTRNGRDRVPAADIYLVPIDTPSSLASVSAVCGDPADLFRGLKPSRPVVPSLARRRAIRPSLKP